MGFWLKMLSGKRLLVVVRAGSCEYGYGFDGTRFDSAPESPPPPVYQMKHCNLSFRPCSPVG